MMAPSAVTLAPETRRDTDLMLLCGGGDRGAFETLLVRYEARLVPYITSLVRDRSEAEDLFQETFLRVYRAAPRYVPKARLSTWLFTIARNLCLNHLAKKREQPAEIEEGSAVEDAGRGVDLAELRGVLEGAMGRLSRPEREAVSLRYVAGMAYRDIAELMGAPLGTVASWVHEGLKKLGPALQRFKPLTEER